MAKKNQLALDGGEPAVTDLPPRHLFGKAEKTAVDRLFDKAIRTGGVFGYNGPEENAYCKEFAEFMGGGYADAVNSGSSAVYVALRALQVPAFSEVVCGPISDPGGIMPIALAGCIPVPADATPGSFNMDPKSLARRVNRRTGAIVVAHIAGIPADMGPIMKIARARGIPVIEDCAQAHGATYRGKLVGTIGDVGAFSTMSGKHHATGAQGGIVFTKDEKTYWRARRCSDRGKPFNLDRSGRNVVAAHNMNLNDLAACIGRVQLRKLPSIVRARRKSAELLTRLCREQLKTVRIVEGPPRSRPVYWFYIAQLDLDRLSVDKAGFVRAAAAEGVPCGLSYLPPSLFVDHEWYRKRRVFEGTDYPWGSPLYKGDPRRDYPVPNVRKTDEYTFTIAMHEKLSARSMRQIARALKKVEAAYLT